MIYNFGTMVGAKNDKYIGNGDLEDAILRQTKRSVP